MRAWREIRDAVLALAVLAGLIGVALLVDRHFGNPDLIEVDGRSLAITDGDSFRIGEQGIRLYGIDAPEYRQTCKDAENREWPCGQQARDALETLARQPGFRCEQRANDRYQRAVALCSTDDTADIGERLVQDGWAISLSYNDTPAYPFAEASAARAGRGVWRGEFVRPADWRAARGAGASR